MTGPVKTTCPYCGVGCGVVATRAADGTVEIAGDPDHPANFGRLCSKGSALAETLGLEDRLLYPEIAGERVSWDRALDEVAGTFRQIIESDGPDAVAFYVSGQLLTEDYYVANKLMKGFIGSANIDTNSRLCMSSSVAGHKRSFGADTVPGNYEDLEQAELLVLVGSNAAWCHPVLYQRITAARKERRSIRTVVIDPRRTSTADEADLHLALAPGTDVILFNGLLVHLWEFGGFDRSGVAAPIDGVADALDAARRSSPDIPSVAAACGLDPDDVAQFYGLVRETEKTVTLYSQGVNQSSHGTDKVNAIINCHLLTGRIGRPGMGPFSLTGQPNAMGGREVGGLANQLAAHMSLKDAAHRAIVGRFWGSQRIPTKPGLTAVELFDAIFQGTVKAVWIMGTNPAVSLPNAGKVRAALKTCFTVVSDCMRRTDTADYADVLLPALAWGEKAGTTTNSERRISRQRAFLPPPGEARADWRIICDVAARLGFAEAFAYSTPVEIFREHAALTAFDNHGTRDLDLGGLAAIGSETYETMAPVQWPVTALAPRGTPRLFGDGRYFTSSGMPRMVAVEATPAANIVDDAFPLILNTGRVRDHWHTMTRTGLSPRLSAHATEPFVDIHPDDAAKVPVEDGALVRIESRWGAVTLKARLSDRQRPGQIFMPIHWSGQFSSGGLVGAVVNPALDPVSAQPELKHTPVRLTAIRAAWRAFAISAKPLSVGNVAYWARARRRGCWLYEFTGTTVGSDLVDELIAEWRGRDGSGIEIIEFEDGARGNRRMAAIINGRLEFCLFRSSGAELPPSDWLASQFALPALPDDGRAAVLAGKPPAEQADTGPTVCSCFGVGLLTLKTAIADRGLTTPEQVGALLQAGTNCGSCLPEIKQLLDRTVRSAQPAAALAAE